MSRAGARLPVESVRAPRIRRVAAPTVTVPAATSDESAHLFRVLSLLGGAKVFSRLAVTSRADVHRLILEGLPAAAAASIVASSTSLSSAAVLHAIGMSLRTLQRGREAPTKSLSTEQSDRAWRLSELLVKATELLGSRDEAERWFDTPAIALDQQRPINLMASSVGARLVETLLNRMEHGVYT